MIRSWSRSSNDAFGFQAEASTGTGFVRLDLGLPVGKLRDALSAVRFALTQRLDFGAKSRRSPSPSYTTPAGDVDVASTI